MKKYLISALAIALIGASIASIAQSAPMDRSSHSMMGMNFSEMQGMHKIMSAAKTDDERNALMSEHQNPMMGMYAPMMSMNAGEHDMNGSPGEMSERQLMQKRMNH
jgi:hypothetical protein